MEEVDVAVDVRGVKCVLYNCQKVESGVRFHHSTLALLKHIGVVFYKAAPYPQPVDPHPELELEPDGRLIAFVIASHPLLDPSNPEWNKEGQFRCSYGTAVEPNSFRMGASYLNRTMPDFEMALQDMARGRREFLKFVIPHVKPRLAFADDCWDSGVKDRHIAAADLKRLFWVTYFGPHYVEQHGIDFFHNIPAWKVEELDGGILLTVTEKFLDFAEHDPKETLKYLKQKFKTIRPNRYKIHPAF